MTDKNPDDDLGEDAAERPLIDDVRALYTDSVAMATAEIAFQKARVSFALGEVKSIAVCGIGALILLHFALVAFTVGAVISLAPLVGAIFATLIVTGILLALAAIVALTAWRHWKRMVAALSDRSAT